MRSKKRKEKREEKMGVQWNSQREIRGTAKWGRKEKEKEEGRM